MFPIGHLTKRRVRDLARRFGLPVAEKPDSQGICFIGKVDIAAFLRTRIPSKPGDIVDAEGVVIGRHEGLDRYTVGQRQHIAIASDHPWYVANKDLATNRLIVVGRDDHPMLTAMSAVVTDLRWTRGRRPRMPFRARVQVRYRQDPVAATVSTGMDERVVSVTFDIPVKAVAPGQSAVFFAGDECLGGGIVVTAGERWT